MPYYKKLFDETSLSGEKKKRIAEKILFLREALDKQIPARTLNSKLILATWNIREFDSSKGGERLIESFYYIAEIIDRFDLVAVQEVRENLKALNKLKDILGSNWDYIYTDVTEGTGGNGERMAFLFDRRKVKFDGLAGEVVNQPIRKKEGNKMVALPSVQWVRTPFICGFKAGWTNFMLCTVHIYYGESKPEDSVRVQEIKQIAEFMKAKADDAIELGNMQSIILMGDFNIFDKKDATFKALTSTGFKVPTALAKDELAGSNVKKDKFYDQIVFLNRHGVFEFTDKAGIFDFYESVFKDGEEDIYEEHFIKKTTEPVEEESSETSLTSKYKTWRTFQMSDHLPMWVEIKIDNTKEYLTKKAEAAVPTPTPN